MKNLLFVLFVVFISFSFFGCDSKVTKVVEISDANQDGVYVLTSLFEDFANVDIYLIPNTLQGWVVLLENGPGAPIGCDMRLRDNPSFICFGKSYISAGGIFVQSGVNLPFEQWITVRLVVYNSSLAGWIVSFLSSLGADFFQSIQNYMIEGTYSIDIKLIQSKSLNYDLEYDSTNFAVKKYKAIHSEFSTYILELEKTISF